MLTPSAAVVVCWEGVYPEGWVSAQGVSARGVSAKVGVCLGGCLLGGFQCSKIWRPPVNRITDACENITLPQLLNKTTYRVFDMYRLILKVYRNFEPQNVGIYCNTIHKKFVQCHVLLNLFQGETEDFTGFYFCITFIQRIWDPVLTFGHFAVIFLILFSIFVHNYARIGRTLFRSLKENVHLQEGRFRQWVKSFFLFYKLFLLPMLSRGSSILSFNPHQWSQWSVYHTPNPFLVLNLLEV